MKPATKKTAKETRRKRRGTRPGRGTLMLIAGLLMGSAFIRMGNDAGQAFAKQGGPDTTGEIEHKPMQPASCEPSPDFGAMLTAFQEREARLKKNEMQMRARMQALAVADQEITQKMAALTQAEEELRATLALADSAAENDLSRLTAVYESMKPKDAAALFEQMDPEFSAGFLGRMRPDAAAGILAGLSPQMAYSISAILAGRNANVPKE